MSLRADKTLNILLLASDAYRVSMLRRSMRQAGLCADIERLDLTAKPAVIARACSGRTGAAPDLVFIDLADTVPAALKTVREVAFGDRASSIPVVLLTSPDAETLLERGELDDGAATMFSARALDTFLAKLVGRRQAPFMRAIGILYAYGPILVKLPDAILERQDDSAQLSA